MLMPGPSSDLEDCDISISTLGHLRSVTGFTWSQVSARISLHFITAGSGQLSHRGRTHKLETGDAFCFFENETYHYADMRDDLWQYTWMALHGRRAAVLLETLSFSPTQPVRRKFPIKSIQDIIKEIDSAYRSEQHSTYFPQTAAWRMLDRFSARHQQRDGDQLAAVLRRILDEEYHQMDISIAQIAEDLQVDRSTLFRHFQQSYQMAPKAYLEQQRMRHASTLLRSHHLNIAEVARHCGYEDARYFSRVFRKHFGVAPSQYP